MPIIDVNGNDLHYLHERGKPARTVPAGADGGGPADPAGAAGPAPTLVCVHGLGTDSLASFYLTMAAPLAAAGIDTVFYDLRGHGNSGRPPRGYTVGDFVADLAGLLGALGLDEPVHLVGNSFGGTIAYGFAAVHPDRVASIVTIEAEPPTQPWADRVGVMLENTRRDLGREDTYTWLQKTFGSHYVRLSRLAYRRLQETSMAEEIPEGPLLGLEDLARIHHPVLSVLGSDGFQAEDPYLLQSVLPNCQTVIIPDQDHSVLVESHRRVRDLTIDWVRRHQVVGVPAREQA
ncbi:alpha/beta fold hydrolase [Frankia sp. QA3]|uniref:alpha/beta fold hydrolase n=1 Tax=Frankia sp. QA3 TaxID=710111 RepID=UPI000269BE1C|nr:alpha/beta fold hydrolase [Frankia sp. QA3]EIV91425.1 putative hydrolase or acyltransferase of alpha/beta superfamily [Frankia sp. QA3]